MEEKLFKKLQALLCGGEQDSVLQLIKESMETTSFYHGRLLKDNFSWMEKIPNELHSVVVMFEGQCSLLEADDIMGNLHSKMSQEGECKFYSNNEATDDGNVWVTVWWN